MNRNIAFLLAASLAAAGCAGAGRKEQEARIDAFKFQIMSQADQLKEKDVRLAALQGEKAELEGRLSDAGQKLSAAQARIDSLVKSNKDLSQALEANKGELQGKVKQLVAEKDALSLQLNEARKDKIALDRAKTTLQAKKDKLAAELADLKPRYDALAARLADLDAEKAHRDQDLAARLAAAHEKLGTLADAMLKELQSGSARIAQSSETVTLVLQESLLFESQQAKLTDAGAAILDRLGAALHALPASAVLVEGHSDSAPLKKELFGGYTSQWDLSSARATAVARYLHEHGGLDPAGLTAAGFGEFRPAASNAEPEGRAANRRIALVIGPR